MPPSGQHHVARREGFMTTPNGRVMFIAAHPDDPDFLAGGTVARLTEEGREVAYVENVKTRFGLPARGWHSRKQ